jgi:hypothetical protein
VYEAAHRVGYDLVIITLPPAPRSRDYSCRRPHLPGVQASGEVAEARSGVRHLRCARAVRVLGRVGARRMGRAARAAGGNLRRPPGGVRLARSRQRAALAGASETSGGVGGSIRRPGAAANASPLEEATPRPRPGAARGPARGRRLVARGLQVALGTLDIRRRRSDDPGRNGGREQGRSQEKPERGRRAVARGTRAPGILSAAVAPILWVSRG